VSDPDPGPCPFCGDEDVDYEPTHDDSSVWLFCGHCWTSWREEP